MSGDADYIDLSGDGGILKKIIQEGTGNCPNSGDEIRAHYTGTLEDGTKFDSSVDRGQEFKFKIGKGSVIKGWDVGFATMKTGEKAILKCRHGLYYTYFSNYEILFISILIFLSCIDLITLTETILKGKSPRDLLLYSMLKCLASVLQRKNHGNIPKRKKSKRQTNLKKKVPRNSKRQTLKRLLDFSHPII